MTTIRLPKSGRLSNQAISSRSATTSPMIVMTGAESLSRATVSRSVASVAMTVRWCGCVPHCTTAAGVSPRIPPAMSASTIRGSVCTPMYSTIVPPARASAAQSVPLASRDGSSCPVTNVTDVATPRWVTGIPAYAAAAIPAVTPGTTSKRTPAAASACASSLPRPKTNGSPPLSRTTRFPSRASRTSSALISACRAGVGRAAAFADVVQLDGLRRARQPTRAREARDSPARRTRSRRR